MRQLSHEKLAVYQKSIQFLAIASKIIDSIPRGNASITDQLKRASLSIVLNIAEGAGKVSRQDKSKFFTIARGSAMECGAASDACKILKVSSDIQIHEGKELLVDIVSMLSALSRPPDFTTQKKAQPET